MALTKRRAAALGRKGGHARAQKLSARARRRIAQLGYRAMLRSLRRRTATR
jgi:hypothetical protein